MIPHRSHVATELTALTKKGAKFKWTPNCQAAFDTLGVVKVGRCNIFHRSFFCDYYALAETSVLAN